MQLNLTTPLSTHLYPLPVILYTQPYHTSLYTPLPPSSYIVYPFQLYCILNLTTPLSTHLFQLYCIPPSSYIVYSTLPHLSLHTFTPFQLYCILNLTTPLSTHLYPLPVILYTQHPTHSIVLLTEYDENFILICVLFG